MSEFHPVIKMRLFLQFLTTMSTMAVIPYLIIFFSGQLGPFITGFLFLGVMFSNVVGTGLGGFISDRIGRKQIILIAESIVCLGFVGAAFANSTWFSSAYATFVLFIFIQLSTGAATPVYQALLIDVSNPENRKKIYTYSYWLRNMAAAIGSMIGAFLFMDYHFYLFIGVSLCTLLSVVLTFLFIHETYQPSKEKVASFNPTKQPFSHLGKSVRSILANRFFFILTIAGFLLVSVEEQLTNYIGVRMDNEIKDPVSLVPFLSLEIDGVNLIGILKTVNSVIVVSCTLLIGWMVSRYQEQYVLMTGMILFFTGYVLISYQTIPWIVLLAMLIASIGEIMYAPIIQTMLANSVPDNKRSSFMAIYNIAAILGVSTAGVFLIISSWVPAMVMTSMMALMGMVSTFLMWNLLKNKESKFSKVSDKTV